MKKRLTLATLAVAIVAPALTPSVAVAQNRRDYDRRYEREHRRDRDYGRCKKSSGTTGTIAGGVGGALAGNALGGGTLGTIAGGAGGALLGRHLDKKHDAAQNRKNGC